MPAKELSNGLSVVVPPIFGDGELDLVRRCVGGDTHAWRALYNRHFPEVERLLGALGVSGADADDLCQEIFLLVHRYLPRFRGDAKLSTWIYRMATREAIRFARRRRLRRALIALFSRSGRSDRPMTWADGAASRRLQLEELMSRLSPERRLVLVLYEIEGLPVSEIARISACAENTIWTRLHRARRDLEKMVEEVRDEHR